MVTKGIFNYQDIRRMSYNRFKELTKNSKKWFKFWTWSTGTLVVAGIAAALIFCPALIPVFIGIISAIINSFATLLNMIVPAFSRLVKGIGSVRTKFKKEAEEDKGKHELDKKKYTSEEVLSIVDNELRIATDEKDKKIIEKVRKKVKV